MKRLLPFLMAFLLLLPQPSHAATITANVEDITHEISDTLYGLFFEDINHAADGGLYAELLQNRSFEYENLLNPQRHDHYTGWLFNITAGAKGTVSVETDAPLNESNPTYIRANVETAPYRLANAGYTTSALRGGVPVDEGGSYDFFIYLRNAGFEGTVDVAITDRAANPLSEVLTITPGDTWQRYDARFTAAQTADAFLTLTLNGTGHVDIDMASLMPANRVGADWPGGGLRRDLVDTLAALHPRFLRFPGGCVAEGSYIRSNVYDWKKTIGPVETRKENFNTWGYMQSYGLGYYEYFCLAELLGAQPLPVVHAGLLCQARDVKEPAFSLDETRAYAQDLLDLIEFANGDIVSHWGALRAEMGHPEPFGLRYIAIGNENWGTAYFTRYKILSQAVKAAYPDVTCIVAAGPVAEGPLINDSWNNIRRDFADSLVDEHYYMDSEWFLQHTDRYDRYPRTTQVFLGEYAAHEPVQGNRRPNNLRSALCEAAYLTGIERNSDVVRMACYAPLMARDGMFQWSPNLIWFDGRSVMKTPNYYVQQMFAASLGDDVVSSHAEGAALYHVVTRTDSAVQVKAVNLAEVPEPLTLHLPGVPDGTGGFTQLSGEPGQQNSLMKPDRIIPLHGECNIADGQATMILPANSVTVVQFSLCPTYDKGVF